MNQNKNYSQTDVIIVGAGPAGLANAIALKKTNPELDICVVDKQADLGNHNLSGAALETKQIHDLLDMAADNWADTDAAKDVLARTVEKDEVYMFLGKKFKVSLKPFLKIFKALGLGAGQMIHDGDYMVSISKLSKWLGQLAADMGVEVLCGFAVEDIIYQDGKATAVTIGEQGIDKEGHKEPNYIATQTVSAKVVVLAEGCDGLISEKFIEQVGLQRQTVQLYSVGIKEIAKVSPEQYESFGDNTCIHAMGYPIWTPLLGPAMFGGAFLYAMGDNKIAIGMIVGADWKYCNFNPQDALTNFKNTSFAQKYIKDAEIVEAGAKMIPEGGYYAIPRCPDTGSIGKANVVILGDSAGFVNMNKIKGLHNGIESGVLAAQAISKFINDCPGQIAKAYTKLVDSSNIKTEMYSSRNMRQTFAKLGPTVGFPFSVISNFLPKFNVEKDYEEMTAKKYKYKINKEFDKDTFTALAQTEHREEQPSHLTILDPAICAKQCKDKFASPCITFCPAGVYENIHDELKAANPSNCLHCKTCQRKCPFDNIRWTVPEGAGGPRYKNM